MLPRFTRLADFPVQVLLVGGAFVVAAPAYGLVIEIEVGAEGLFEFASEAGFGFDGVDD